MGLLINVCFLRGVIAKVREVLDYFQGLFLNVNLKSGEGGHIHGLEWLMLMEHFSLPDVTREAQSWVGFCDLNNVCSAIMLLLHGDDMSNLWSWGLVSQSLAAPKKCVCVILKPV